MSKSKQLIVDCGGKKGGRRCARSLHAVERAHGNLAGIVRAGPHTIFGKLEDIIRSEILNLAVLEE